jgi:hypothetical protein
MLAAAKTARAGCGGGHGHSGDAQRNTRRPRPAIPPRAFGWRFSDPEGGEASGNGCGAKLRRDCMVAAEAVSQCEEGAPSRSSHFPGKSKFPIMG